MLYFKYIRMVIRSLFQYRFSLWMGIIGQFLVAFFTFIGIALLFERFGSLAGWTFPEVALCYAVTHISFAVSECVGQGFNLFSTMIVKGDFDRIILRPRTMLLQILGSGFEISRVGNLVQGGVILCIALSGLETAWDASKIITLIGMILAGIAIFTGILIAGSAICFFTIEGLEVVNIFTYGGQETASYPLPIYGKALARFFTFVIPFAGMNYLPLLYITGRAADHLLLYMMSPLMAIPFLGICILIWNRAAKHYSSTGA